MSATGSARDAGTTLLEAMVVVSITALVAGLIFPALQRTLDLLALRQGTATLAANVRAARAQAIRTGGPTAFVIAPDGEGYAWSGGRGVPRIGHGVHAGPAGGRLVFFADGSSSGGAITLTGGGRREGVGVDAATGATRIQP